VVLVSHSFGNLIMAIYLQKYASDQIVGLISIGGMAVQAHTRIKISLDTVRMFGEKSLW
jgi:predicted alpha/beta hydrolase family esterase